jgi:bifunctional glutamyl/prolyl-tRNA synthetase
MAMAYKLTLQKTSSASLIPLVTAELIKDQVSITTTFGQTISIQPIHQQDVVISGAMAVSRFLCRLVKTDLYGQNNLEKAEIDHWLEYSVTSLNPQCNLQSVMSYLDNVLTPRVYLVGYSLTLADVAVFASLRGLLGPTPPHPSNLLRWFNFIAQQDSVKSGISQLPINEAPKGRQADVGKFVELPGAERGKVITRFPPEASGYLHIGHDAKTARLNQRYQTISANNNF